MLTTCILSAEDFDQPETARLLAWCHANGADEFSIEYLSAAAPASVWAGFVARMASHAVKAADGVSAERWRFNAETARALAHVLPYGLRRPPTSQPEWFEDLELWRDGEDMLTAITHEGYAILTITDLEAATFSAAGFRIFTSVADARASSPHAAA